jgi:hypothetical protein
MYKGKRPLPYGIADIEADLQLQGENATEVYDA